MSKFTLTSPDGKTTFETDSPIVANDYQFGHGWKLDEGGDKPARTTATPSDVNSAKGVDSK